MKKRNLLSLVAFTLASQLFFSCNSARHYEFSNRSEAYHTENALVKATTETNETALPDKVENERPASDLSASASEEIVLPVSMQKVNLKTEVKQPEENSEKVNAPALKLNKVQKKELKNAFKQLKKQKLQKNETSAQPTVDIVELILAIFIPPLGVLLHDGGISTRFWISLLLTILFFFPGMIYALLVVTDTI